MLGVVLAVGCAAPEEVAGAIDPIVVGGQAAGATASCALPERPGADEVTPLQTDLVTRLTALGDRATPAHRDAAREMLGSALEEAGLAPELHAYGSGTNVWAALEATEASEEWLVLGAHFDTVARSPGANDNATGAALVLAVARHLRTLPCRSANVAFVFFDQEEIGLVGSKAFARKLEREGARVRAVHTVDQMGWDRNGDRLIELERPDTGLAEQYREAVDALAVSLPIRVTSTSTSDHSAFRPTFPAIGVTEGYRSGDTTPNYHRPTDTLATVDFPYLFSSTRLVAEVLRRALARD